MEWTTKSSKVLEYVLTGEENPQGLVWGYINRWRQSETEESVSRDVINDAMDNDENTKADN